MWIEIFTCCVIVITSSLRINYRKRAKQDHHHAKDALNNVHITDEQVLMTPEQLKAEFPLSQAQEAQISQSRKTISDIISGRDPRLLVVCGPCSIHDPEMAIEYARRFKALAAEVSDSLYW